MKNELKELYKILVKNKSITYGEFKNKTLSLYKKSQLNLECSYEKWISNMVCSARVKL